MKRMKKTLALRAGENVKRLIKESHWRTQAEFAYAFGVDERTVGRWCNRGIDKLSHLEAIADFLGVDVKEDLLR